MSILTPHDVQTIDRVGVGGAREGGTLNGGSFPTACIPQNNLSGVSPSNYVARVEFTEGHRHHWTLCEIHNISTNTHLLIQSVQYKPFGGNGVIHT